MNGILNIITLLQLALSLLANPQVQQNPQMLAQANTFASQAIVIAENEVAIEAAAANAPTQGQIGSAASTEAPVVSTDATTSPTVDFEPTGQVQVSNQFALDPNAADEWLNGSHGWVQQTIMATTTDQFTIAGRLIQDERDVSGQQGEKWFAMSGIPLTITYGDQSQTATTDSNGVAQATFHAIGVAGDHRFTYSAPGMNITDYGTINEQATQ